MQKVKTSIYTRDFRVPMDPDRFREYYISSVRLARERKLQQYSHAPLLWDSSSSEEDEDDEQHQQHRVQSNHQGHQAHQDYYTTYTVVPSHRDQNGESLEDQAGLDEEENEALQQQDEIVQTDFVEGLPEESKTKNSKGNLKTFAKKAVGREEMPHHGDEVHAVSSKPKKLPPPFHLYGWANEPIYGEPETHKRTFNINASSEIYAHALSNAGLVRVKTPSKKTSPGTSNQGKGRDYQREKKEQKLKKSSISTKKKPGNGISGAKKEPKTEILQLTTTSLNEDGSKTRYVEIEPGTQNGPSRPPPLPALEHGLAPTSQRVQNPIRGGMRSEGAATDAGKRRGSHGSVRKEGSRWVTEYQASFRDFTPRTSFH